MAEICNIKITDKSRADLFVPYPDLQVLIPMNAECLVKSNSDALLKDFINSKRTTIDGQIPLWLFKIKNPSEKIEKLSGSDIVYDFCEYASLNNLKVFFLGGKESSNCKAIRNLREKYPSLDIDGYSPPYEPYPFSMNNNSRIKDRLSEFKPDIVFIGFGFGKQEYWVKDNQEFLKDKGVKWTVCCGGTFEFISGEIKRAPVMIQKIGLEGFWRLLMEPKLFRVKRLITSFKIFKYAYKK